MKKKLLKEAEEMGGAQKVKMLKKKENQKSQKFKKNKDIRSGDMKVSTLV